MEVNVVSILRLEKHPNADRLAVAYVNDWPVVVGKDDFQIGDFAVYFPVDCVLPVALATKILDKEVLKPHRVRTIKLRKQISQGILVSPAKLGLKAWTCGDDVAKLLGVVHYEPPVTTGLASGIERRKQRLCNPFFHVYSGIENFKNVPHLFHEGDQVWVSEKIHGTNFRCGWVPFHPTTLWLKIKQCFGMNPDYEFCYGSHNVQLGSSTKRNAYIDIVEKYDLKNILQDGEVLYGEIYGWGVQKGFPYDCHEGERKLVVLDVEIHGNFIDPAQVSAFCRHRELPRTPVDLIGGFRYETMLYLVSQPSQLTTSHIREGIVIRSAIGRKILKLKSDEFMLKIEDDSH